MSKEDVVKMLKEIENNQTYVKGYKDGVNQGIQKALEIIESEETEIPDDDGIPAQISSEVFKRVILKKIGDAGK